MASLRERIPLRKRKIIKKSFFKVLMMSFAVVVLSVIYFPLLDVLTEDSTFFQQNRHIFDTVFYLVCAGLLLFSPIYQYLYYRAYFYDIDDQNVIIRKGVISKKEITMPFAKVTDVYVDRDFGDVILGLYDIYLSTPTSESGIFAHIDGVNREGSVELRKLILERVNKVQNPPS